MCIFIIYICLIGPLFCFDYMNFKASLVIKIINFNRIKNVAMLAIFYGNVIICQTFILPHIYYVFVF
jgi:hypothetical protein